MPKFYLCEKPVSRKEFLVNTSKAGDGNFYFTDEYNNLYLDDRFSYEYILIGKIVVSGETKDEIIKKYLKNFFEGIGE